MGVSYGDGVTAECYEGEIAWIAATPIDSGALGFLFFAGAGKSVSTCDGIGPERRAGFIA